MEPTLVIMRGLPGSGKSYYTSRLIRKLGGLFGIWPPVCSADQFFQIQTGTYKFDPEKIGDAHKWSQDSARASMAFGWPVVVVDNTNTQRWEMQPYIEMAEKYGYRVVERTVGERDSESIKKYHSRNSHGVPLEVIEKMAERWEE
jgi:predicted kinase